MIEIGDTGKYFDSKKATGTNTMIDPNTGQLVEKPVSVLRRVSENAMPFLAGISTSAASAIVITDAVSGSNHDSGKRSALGVLIYVGLSTVLVPIFSMIHKQNKSK